LNFINVRAGAANIGSNRLSEGLLSTSGGFLGGVRHVEFGAFRIGRYPVTNAEFRAFVEDDGYTNLQYWEGELARGWVSGDSKVLEMIRQHWLSTLYEHHAKEIRDGEIDTSASEEESIRRTSPRLEPYYWSDRRFNQPNQPVVGINWWEASAFCAWATKLGHETGKLDPDQVIRLPTEFEWEYASRPADDDRIYPWGDVWSEEKAHVSTNTLNMRQPAPVGIYLEAWTDGPCDMAGNVWEWTASLHVPYSAEYDCKRLSDDSLEERVVRGSSWYNSSIVAACSARAVDRSYNLFYDVGFRVVSLPRDQDRACSS
jgi:formylglycine-generating enzyme required for sulfatase activity